MKRTQIETVFSFLSISKCVSLIGHKKKFLSIKMPSSQYDNEQFSSILLILNAAKVIMLK